LALDQNGRPIRTVITAGTTADCSPTEDLRPRIQAQHLLTNGGYGDQAILPKINQVEMRPVIRSKKKRKFQRNDNPD